MPVKPSDSTVGFYRMAGSEKPRTTRANVGMTGSNPYSHSSNVRANSSNLSDEKAKVTAEYLKELPSFNENNFSRFQADTSLRNNMKKPSVYFPRKDHPCEQIIITEKTTILLRYLQQQYEKKKAQLKRELEKAGPSGSSPRPKKKSRHGSQS